MPSAITLIFSAAVSLGVQPPVNETAALASLDGVEALETGRWQDAIEAFSRAIEADEENNAHYRGRGVAKTLAGKYADAIKDLQRAQRLNQNDREARLWMGVAYNLNGDFFKANENSVHGMGIPTDYWNFVFNELKIAAMSHDPQYSRPGETPKPMEPLLKQAGAWYASRNKSQPGLAKPLFERSKKRYAVGDFAGALKDVSFVRTVSPDDPAVQRLFADCRLATGDSATARDEYTRLLIRNSADAGAYLGHAVASARLGSRKRAEADVATAEKLGADGKSTREAIAAATSETATAADLEKAVRDDADQKKLTAIAMAVHRSANANRLRHDEWYQDQLRALESSLKAEPKNPNRIAALAVFLAREANVRGEKVEPRSPFVSYRYQTPAMLAAELARAAKLADQALALDGGCVAALVTKARLLLRQGRYGDAENVLRTALAKGPENPEVFEVYADALESLARLKATQASALRTPDTWTAGDWIYTRYPSQAERAQAASLERQAEELFERASAVIEAAIKARNGSADGHLYAALWHRKHGRVAEAKAEAEKGLAMEPSIRGYELLASILQREGKAEEAFAAQAKALNLVQTTAGPYLRLAGMKIARTAFKSAKQALGEGTALDPADARVFAYRGVIAQAEEKTAEAVVYFKAALALEEARAKLASASVEGPGEVRPVLEFGLAMVIRNRLGRLLLAQNKPAEAMPLFTANAELEKRVSRYDWPTEVWTAMLPNSSDEPNYIPVAEIPPIHFAVARLGIGDSLVGLKKWKDAIAVYSTIKEGGVELSTVRGNDRLHEPIAWAKLGMVKAYLGMGDRNRAFQMLQQVPRSTYFGAFKGLPEERAALAKQLQGSSNGGADVRDGENAEEDFDAARKKAIDDFKKRRDELEKKRKKKA